MTKDLEKDSKQQNYGSGRSTSRSEGLWKYPWAEKKTNKDVRNENGWLQKISNLDHER